MNDSHRRRFPSYRRRERQSLNPPYPVETLPPARKDRYVTPNPPYCPHCSHCNRPRIPRVCWRSVLDALGKLLVKAVKSVLELRARRLFAEVERDLIGALDAMGPPDGMIADVGGVI